MGLIEVIVIAVESIFLFIQGILINGYISGFDSQITLPNINENIVMWIIGLKVSSWGILLGIIGFILILGGLIENKVAKKADDDDTSKKFYIIACVGYAILCVCSIL